jgi:hypothetical protein
MRTDGVPTLETGRGIVTFTDVGAHVRLRRALPFSYAAARSAKTSASKASIGKAGL